MKNSSLCRIDGTLAEHNYSDQPLEVGKLNRPQDMTTINRPQTVLSRSKGSPDVFRRRPASPQIQRYIPLGIFFETNFLVVDVH